MGFNSGLKGLMPYLEIIAIFFRFIQITDVFCGQNAEFLNVKPGRT
jgi:hypothetical protein